MGIDESAFSAMKPIGSYFTRPWEKRVFAVATLLLLSAPHHRGSENMGSFTRISVAPRESVAFSFKVSNFSLKSFALLFSVF